MKPLTTLYVIVIALVLLNLFSIGFIWMNKGQENRGRKRDFRKVSELLTERLELTDDQQQKMIEIRKSFLDKEAGIDLQMRPLRDSMNLLMFSENTDTVELNRLARKIADYHFQIELLRMEQAKQFKSICNEKQQRAFKKIVFDIRDYFKKERR